MALRHLLICLFVGLLCAALVYLLWYPEPSGAMLGVTGIFWLIVVADVVTGPLLTLVLANPKKSSLEMTLDLTLVGLIQVGALAYGLHAAYLGRPVMLVHEVDRFVLVSASDVQEDRFDRADPAYRRLPLWGVGVASLRAARDGDEFLKSLEEDLAGVSPAMRPDWWRAYDAEAKAAVLARAKPLSDLIRKHANQAAQLQRAADRAGLSVDKLHYLPLTSKRDMGWVALLDETGVVVGHAPVDGFD